VRSAELSAIRSSTYETDEGRQARRATFVDNVALAALLSVMAFSALAGAIAIIASGADGALKATIGTGGVLIGGALVAFVVYILNDPATRAPQPRIAGSQGSSAAYSALAIAAFVAVFVTVVPGIVLGHLALREIARTGKRGRGLSIAALTVGYLSVECLTIAGVVLLKTR